MRKEQAQIVIAAALALPLVEAEIDRIEKTRPSGNMESAHKRHAELDKKLEPIYLRQDELRNIVLYRESS